MTTLGFAWSSRSWARSTTDRCEDGGQPRPPQEPAGYLQRAESAQIDPEFLRTLPQRYVVNGLAEIKMALIKDAALFELLESMVADICDAVPRAVAAVAGVFLARW